MAPQAEDLIPSSSSSGWAAMAARNSATAPMPICHVRTARARAWMRSSLPRMPERQWPTNAASTPLRCPAPIPPIDMDADLRPEGRNGPKKIAVAGVVRGLLRPVVGDVGRPRRCVRARWPAAGAAGRLRSELIDPIRYPSRASPADSLGDAQAQARMEAERLAAGCRSGATSETGTRRVVGRRVGGATAATAERTRPSELRTTRTVPGPGVLVMAIGPHRGAGRRTARRRVATGLGDPGRDHASSGRAGDPVPTDYRTLGRVAHLLNYPPSDRGGNAGGLPPDDPSGATGDGAPVPDGLTLRRRSPVRRDADVAPRPGPGIRGNRQQPIGPTTT